MSGAFKYGTIFNTQAHTLRMQKTLTTVLALACALNLDISQAQTTEGPLEEIVVTGEFAGPGMWEVTHPDHPGHTLWIVGEPPLLPYGMTLQLEEGSARRFAIAGNSPAAGAQSCSPTKKLACSACSLCCRRVEIAQRIPTRPCCGKSVPARRVRALAGAKKALSWSRFWCGENAASSWWPKNCAMPRSSNCRLAMAGHW